MKESEMLNFSIFSLKYASNLTFCQAILLQEFEWHHILKLYGYIQWKHCLNLSLLDKLLLLLEWTAAIKDNIIKGKESTYKTHQHLQSCLTTIIDFAWLQDQWNAHEASANYGVTRSYRCLRGWGEHSSSYNQACILLSIN